MSEQIHGLYALYSTYNAHIYVILFNILYNVYIYLYTQIVFPVVGEL